MRGEKKKVEVRGEEGKKEKHEDVQEEEERKRWGGLKSETRGAREER